MRVLYTAFKGKNNSSKILIDLIEKGKKLYITNSFTTSITELENELKCNSYDLIIAFGRSTLEKDTIKIETVGRLFYSYKTTYDYKFLKEKLENNNYKVKISTNAGKYLCNNFYYNGLKYIKNHNLNTKMIFIHLPGLSKITDIQNLANIFNEIGDLQWQKNT